jgi:hypothetical protein
MNPTNQEVVMSDHIVTLEERLQAHPVLKKRVESLLQIVEEPLRAGGTADDAEVRVIEEVRRLGKELLQEWATTKERERVEGVRKTQGSVVGHGKKNCIGTPHLAP